MATTSVVLRPLVVLSHATCTRHTRCMSRVVELHPTRRVNGPWTIHNRRGSVRSTSRPIQTDEQEHVSMLSPLTRPTPGRPQGRPWGVPTVDPGRPCFHPVQIRKTTQGRRVPHDPRQPRTSCLLATTGHLDSSGRAYVDDEIRSQGTDGKGSGEAADGDGLLSTTRHNCRYMHRDTCEGRSGGGRDALLRFVGRVHGIDVSA